MDSTITVGRRRTTRDSEGGHRCGCLLGDPSEWHGSDRRPQDATITSCSGGGRALDHGLDRGQVGGYRLGRPASEISIADIIRAVEGPLADVRGTRPEALRFTGPAAALRDVWLANRVSVRRVLEQVTIADVVADDLPADVRELLDDADALVGH